MPESEHPIMSENKKEGGSKVRLVLFLFVLLMEYGSKYSILKEEKFLSGHPPFVFIVPDYFTLSPYERSVVLTLIFSPWLMKRGTMIVAPVSSVASLRALVEAVSPFTAGSV